jgi:hypothetical protein
MQNMDTFYSALHPFPAAIQFRRPKRFSPRVAENIRLILDTAQYVIKCKVLRIFYFKQMLPVDNYYHVA